MFQKIAVKPIFFAILLISFFFMNHCSNYGEGLNSLDDTTKPSNQLIGPIFSPDGGSSAIGFSVSMYSIDSGAIICYSVAENPSCNSEKTACSIGNVYSEPVKIFTTTTLRAITCKTGKTDSNPTGALYNIISDNGVPSAVTSFLASARDAYVDLTWVNPSDADFLGVKVLRKTTDDISGPGDLSASVIYISNGTSYKDTNVTNGTAYYYKAYTYDTNGYFSLEASTAATPINNPILLSSTPAHNAVSVAPCEGTPCRAKITLVFSESMDSSELSHTLSTAVWNGSSYVGLPNTTLDGAWSQTNVANDTLTIPISWLLWPENSKVRWALNTANLKDIEGNVLSSSIADKIFTTTTRQVAFPIADTGQTACYNTSGNVIACGGTDWPRQDADYANTPNARSFTGPIAHATYGSDYTTTDNVTGLVWRSCSVGQYNGDCSGGTATQMTWVNAVNACASLNPDNAGAGYAGRTNWRLPTVSELETLPNYGVSNPAIDMAHFPATPTGTYTWTSTTHLASPGSAWVVGFGVGGVYYYVKTGNYYVRCVSAN